MKTKIKIISCIMSAILFFISCSKQKDETENKQAIMKMAVSYTGDIQSQVAVLTFLAVNSSNGLVSILNENTGDCIGRPLSSK